MKNTFKIFLGCAVLASALTAGTVRSQGTAGAAQLLIPVGTETVALSGTNVGTVSGIDALFTKQLDQLDTTLGYKDQFQLPHTLLILM